VTIFVFFLDLNSVSGALVVGYATASCALTFIVLRSDWERLARLMQEMNNPLEGDGLDYLEDFDDESSDDDDDDDYDESSEEASAQHVRQPTEHSQPKGLRQRSPQETG
jgi:regulator of RNase E activity RraB